MPNTNFHPFPVLKTERLILRQLTSGDEHDIFELRSNETVNKYLGRKPAQSIDDAKKFIELINGNIEKNDSIYWVITLNDSNHLIGTICLFDFSNDRSQAEIGFELLPQFYGRGIMQEAISKVIEFATETMNLQCIEAYSHPDNKQSIKLLEKFNFKREGTPNGNIELFRLTLHS